MAFIPVSAKALTNLAGKLSPSFSYQVTSMKSQYCRSKIAVLWLPYWGLIWTASPRQFIRVQARLCKVAMPSLAYFPHLAPP